MYSVFKVACLYDSSCNDAAIIFYFHIFYWQPPVSIENMIERCGEHVRVCVCGVVQLKGCTETHFELNV